MDTASFLGTSTLYLCTPSFGDLEKFREFTQQVIAGGIDIIQLRDRSLDVASELKFYEVLKEVTARTDVLVAVNDRADLAAVIGADILHLGQKDLPPNEARNIVGPQTLIGLSTSGEQLAYDAAARDEVDYFCVGPLWETPTKPGRKAIGLETLTRTATELKNKNVTKPWFAIGGIEATNLKQVLDAGARRVVVVRALTEAIDPYEETKKLKAQLRS